MDKFTIWIILGITLVLIAIVYFSIRTGKRRAREVEELNTHFPESTNQPLTVEKMRGKLNRSQKADSGIEAGLGRETKTDISKEEFAGAKEEVVEESHDETPAINSDQVEQVEDLEKPVRYKRSIFHPDHLKKESDESRSE